MSIAFFETLQIIILFTDFSANNSLHFEWKATHSPLYLYRIKKKTKQLQLDTQGDKQTLIDKKFLKKYKNVDNGPP